MASMQSVQPRVGYTDLVNMPEDGRRYEIYGGELVVVAAPAFRHQMAVFEIAAVLNNYGRKSGGRAVTAPFDIVFDEHDVVQPDLVFFRRERLHVVHPDVVTRAAPDIAVEVLSPSTAAIDRGRKMRLFARYGVPECWIVDPVARRIEVHALEEGAYRETQVAADDDIVRSVLLPDLTFEAARIFELP